MSKGYNVPEKKIVEVGEVILFNKKNKVLMQLRDNKKNVYGANKWSILGGKKEKYENPEACAKREIKEEIGLEIEKLELLGIIEDEDKDNEIIFRHYIYYSFINRTVGKLIIAEGQEVRFCDFNEILSLDKVVWFNKVYLNILLKLDKIYKLL